jgi:O-antigen ligase
MDTVGQLDIPSQGNTTTRHRLGLAGWFLAFVFLVLLMGRGFLKTPLLAIALLSYCLLLLPRYRHAAQLLAHSYSMLALLVFFSASYTWSLVPHASGDVILNLCAFAVLCFSVAVFHAVDGFLRALRVASMTFVLLVVLYVAINPSSISSAGLTAFQMHKNSLGAMSALCFLTLAFSPGRRWWHVGLAVVALALVVASLSKTSSVMLAICIALVPIASFLVTTLYQRGDRLLLADAVRYAGLGAMLLGLIAVVVWRNEILALTLEQLPKDALTGRGQLWRLVIRQLRDHSLVGIGPGVFWLAGGASEIAQTTMYWKDAHWLQRMASSDGGYVDLIASLGFVGLSLFLLTAADTYRRLFRVWVLPDSRALFVLVTFVLLHAATESTILYSTNILWFIYLLIYFRAVILSRARGERPTEGRPA